MKTRSSASLPDPIQRVVVVVSGLIAIAVLSHCSGGSQPPFVVPPPPVPSLEITTTALPNGVMGIAYNQTIQATGGVAPFVWMLSSGTLPPNLSLGASTNNSVTISGTPESGAQGVGFTVSITDSAHHTAIQSYALSILLQSDSLILSPGGLDFGNELVGTASGTLAETLTNAGTSNVAIASITTNDDAEFNQTTTCGASLVAGASCVINVTFTPAQSGPRSAVITIIDDTQGSPQSVYLTGVGLTSGPNATLSANNLSFDSELVDTTSPPLSLVVNNYGTATLNITGVAAPAGFAETDNCIPSLTQGANCTIKVTFTPSTSGEVSGTLSISDNAASSPQTVSLSGIGATNTPPLTGYCFATCQGQVKNLDECPVGQPAITPSEASIWPCGPPGSVPVDASRACHVKSVNSPGHCVIQ